MSNFTPAWFKKGFFNESLFCDDFLSTHQLLYSNGAFFTPDGRMVDPMPLRCEIFEMMREYVGANLAKKVTNVVDVLKLAAQVEDFPPVTDRIALANGTLYLDGTFQEGKPEIVRNRLPVRYDPKAPLPSHWLRFLSDLLYPEDIPTVQEFIGYCLIPSNKGQRMMVIKGSGSLKTADRFLLTMGIAERSLQVAARVNDQETIKNLVQSGLGVSFLSERAARAAVQEKRLLQFELPVESRRALYLAHRRDYILQPHIRAFCRFVAEYGRRG